MQPSTLSAFPSIVFSPYVYSVFWEQTKVKEVRCLSYASTYFFSVQICLLKIFDVLPHVLFVQNIFILPLPPIHFTMSS